MFLSLADRSVNCPFLALTMGFGGQSDVDGVLSLSLLMQGLNVGHLLFAFMKDFGWLGLSNVRLGGLKLRCLIFMAHACRRRLFRQGKKIY
jgi:hypothetical protein